MNIENEIILAVNLVKKMVKNAVNVQRSVMHGTARPEVTVKCVQLENNLNSRRFAIRVENDLAGQKRLTARRRGK